MTNVEPTERVRAFYRQYAPRYDHQTTYYDRFLLGDGRAWACAQSRGAVLEVAIGTGRNLPYFPSDRRLTGIDLTPGNAHPRPQPRPGPGHGGGAAGRRRPSALPFAAASFDSVVCTLGLNAIPDDQAAVGEMYRVLRPGGRLVLLGHVASPYRMVQAIQRVIERWLLPVAGDHQTRQPLPLLRAAGFVLDREERSRAGIIQRLVATKPGDR
jgi:ubiquinone/menaquinone biosynthesis C-methylase UbiE